LVTPAKPCRRAAQKSPVSAFSLALAAMSAVADEARRIAVNIARLPGLLGKGERD
jgi:hypothetical protein